MHAFWLPDQCHRQNLYPKIMKHIDIMFADRLYHFQNKIVVFHREVYCTAEMVQFITFQRFTQTNMILGKTH